MSLHDDLVAAKALIDTPEKWAQMVDGKMWGSDRNCAHQALVECCRGGFDAVSRAIPLGWKISQRLKGRWSVLPSSNIIRFNDAVTTTHPDIMALFDRAIAAASVSS